MRSLLGLRKYAEHPYSSKRGASALIGVRGGGGRYISYYVWASQLVRRRRSRPRPLRWKSTVAPRYPPPRPAPGMAAAPSWPSG